MTVIRELWSLWRRDEQWIIIACLMCLSLCGGVGYARHRSASTPPPLFQEATPVIKAVVAPATSSDATPQKTILVHVAGAVHKPGMYALPASARVITAVEQAGGATNNGDVQAINLAAVVKDGQQIKVPERGGHQPTSTGLGSTNSGAGATQANAGSADVGIVNINLASVAELEKLPGVGPAIAARIVRHRQQHGPFKRIEDLDSVKGIGTKKLEKLRAFITF